MWIKGVRILHPARPPRNIRDPQKKEDMHGRV